MQRTVEIKYLKRPVVTKFKETVKGVYKITPKGGKVRRYIGRLLEKALHKVSDVSPYFEEKTITEVERVTVDFTEVEKAIFDNVTNVRRLNEEPFMVLMGGEQFHMLESNMRSVSFRFPHDYRSNTYYGNEPIQFAGLEVKIVPWMDGILVVPK